MTVQQQIFRLQVSVDNLLRMEIFEGKNHFGCIKLGHRVGESLNIARVSHFSVHLNTKKDKYLRLAQQAKQFTTLDEIHDHVEIARILPSPPQSNQERVSGATQHASLVVGMFDLLHLHDLRLLEDLQSVEPMVMVRLHQVNPPETTGTQRALQTKVFQRVFVLGGAIRPAGAYVRLRLLAGRTFTRGIGIGIGIILLLLRLILLWLRLGPIGLGEIGEVLDTIAMLVVPAVPGIGMGRLVARSVLHGVVCSGHQFS